MIPIGRLKLANMLQAFNIWRQQGRSALQALLNSNQINFKLFDQSQQLPYCIQRKLVIL
jgi:hypothetical protein